MRVVSWDGATIRAIDCPAGVPARARSDGAARLFVLLGQEETLNDVARIMFDLGERNGTASAGIIVQACTVRTGNQIELGAQLVVLQDDATPDDTFASQILALAEGLRVGRRPVIVELQERGLVKDVYSVT